MVEPIQDTGSLAPNVTQALRARIEQIREQTIEKVPAPELAVQPRFTGVSFRPIDNPPVIQARVIDRQTQEVLREVPSTEELRFSRSFRNSVAELIGQRLDIRA